jgi:hypothetical protein
MNYYNVDNQTIIPWFTSDLKERLIHDLIFFHGRKSIAGDAGKTLRRSIRPLTNELGSQRILRTSTLVPVPEICCSE